MAKAKVSAAGIEYIQGALKRPKKKNGHNHGNYLVATHRKADSTNPNCQRLYTFDSDRYDRITPIREDEAIARELFTQRAAWVKSRAASLQHLAQDQEDFLAQKNTAQGATTMKAYYWKLAKAQVTAASLNG